MSKNVKTSSPTLDLHGAKKEEVLAKLDRFLTQANEKGHTQVRVMTGKGTGTIQAEVVKLLKQAHYPWKFERLANGTENTGVLVVFVK
jgi:DNA-nicking Smr family endonuclease